MLKAAVLGVVAALATSLLISSVAASQPPSPTSGVQSSAEQKPITADQQETTADKQRADKLPVALKIQNPAKTQEQTNWEADYQERSTADQRMLEIGIGAIVVGFIQALALFLALLFAAFVGIRQLRAYIYPTVSGIKNFSLTAPIEITVIFKNAGLTPARNVETSSAIFPGTLPLLDASEPEEPREPSSGVHSKMVIYPGAEHAVDTQAEGIISPEIINLLKQRKPTIAIYISGETRYRDMFYQKRITRFCLFIQPEDTVALIEAEENHTPLAQTIHFVSSHIHNRFT